MYGFRGLISDFLSSHPGYHVNLQHVNGSGVETLFGQLKHTTGRNLTGHSYETAKATLLTRRTVNGTKTKDDTTLNMRQAELRRKKCSWNIIERMYTIIIINTIITLYCDFQENILPRRNSLLLALYILDRSIV